MELWIRNQDKEDLIEVHSVEVDIKDKIKIITLINANTIIDLGTYKSKERAIEVINEIEQRLIDLQTLEIAPDFYKVCKRCLDIVYEMPKE